MGKAKRRSLKLGVHDKFQYMTRESALESVIKNIENNSIITCVFEKWKRLLKER